MVGIEEKKVFEYGEIFTKTIKEFCERNKLPNNLTGVYQTGIYVPKYVFNSCYLLK